MKRKICMALLALSSGLMIVFAAGVDKCTEKSDACKTSCTNLRSQCVARGNTVESCDSRLKQCEAGCAKDLKDCQAKAAPAKPAASPKPAKPKK